MSAFVYPLPTQILPRQVPRNVETHLPHSFKPLSGTTFHNRLRLILPWGLFLRDWVFHDCSRVISEKTWTTRKALQSLFLSLYFWHKPIKLQHRKMRGRWSQILSFPSHSPWFYTAAALQRNNLGEKDRWNQIRLQQPSAGIQCYCTSIKKSNSMTITTPLNSNSDCCNLICDHLSPSPRLGPCARFVTSTVKFELGSPWVYSGNYNSTLYLSVCLIHILTIYSHTSRNLHLLKIISRSKKKHSLLSAQNYHYMFLKES